MTAIKDVPAFLLCRQCREVDKILHLVCQLDLEWYQMYLHCLGESK